MSFPSLGNEMLPDKVAGEKERIARLGTVTIVTDEAPIAAVTLCVE